MHQEFDPPEHRGSGGPVAAGILLVGSYALCFVIDETQRNLSRNLMIVALLLAFTAGVLYFNFKKQYPTVVRVICLTPLLIGTAVLAYLSVPLMEERQLGGTMGVLLAAMYCNGLFVGYKIKGDT